MAESSIRVRPTASLEREREVEKQKAPASLRAPFVIVLWRHCLASSFQYADPPEAADLARFGKSIDRFPDFARCRCKREKTRWCASGDAHYFPRHAVLGTVRNGCVHGVTRATAGPDAKTCRLAHPIRWLPFRRSFWRPLRRGSLRRMGWTRLGRCPDERRWLYAPSSSTARHHARSSC